MKMKPQAPEQLEYTKRHGQITAQFAIKDIWDALIELITNSDESYGRMGVEDGQTLIEVEHRKGRSRVIVRDRGEGMSLQEMRKKIKKVGDRTSAEGDRGFMGRGAKDCAVLGKILFESIKDGRYSKCEVLTTMDFRPYTPSIRVTQSIRESLGIPRGNGTVVTIDIKENVRIPRHKNLLSDLPKLYALRDIMHKESCKRLFLRNLNEDTPADRLIYEDPISQVIVNEQFQVDGYPETKAQITIQKANERLESTNDKRFRRSGIMVKSTRAVHEVTFFTREFEDEPYAEFYFGKLSCPYIDKLCEEYDQIREKGIPHPEENPILIIDPNRQAGLRRDHPFTEALFRVPKEHLRSLIAQDKEKERQKRVQIENEQTKQQLKRLAKAASKFIKDKVDELREFALKANEIETHEFTKKGVSIIPSVYTLFIGEIKTFGFRAKKMPGISPDEIVKVTCADKGLRIITPEFMLSPSPTSEGVLTGSFRVQGLRETRGACLKTIYNGLPKAEALITVVKSKVEQVEFTGTFSFEKKTYRVREGKKKRLLLRAKYPSVVAEDTPVEVSSDSSDIVILKPRARIRPIAGTNYAEGYVTIQGRRLGARGKIRAGVHGYSAETRVKVIQAEPEEGVPIGIEIRAEDYGNLRAQWDYAQNPNLLLISAKHDSIKRYLGPSPSFEGQNSPHFQLLLAEIVSENVARKILEYQERETPWEFENLSVNNFYYIHNKLMKEFTPIAHEVQLSKSKLESLK